MLQRPIRKCLKSSSMPYCTFSYYQLPLSIISCINGQYVQKDAYNIAFLHVIILLLSRCMILYVACGGLLFKHTPRNIIGNMLLY